MVNTYIVCEINFWQFAVGQDFILQNSFFGPVKLTTNADPDKNKYSACCIGFDASESFSLFDDSGFGKSVILLGTDTGSSMYIDNMKKYILILGKVPMQGIIL